jgi:6-phosphogluconolactonase
MKQWHFLLCLLLFACNRQMQEVQDTEFLYVGTFSVRGSEGVYVYGFDRSARKFSPIQQVGGPDSPSFLDIHPNGQYLYTANRGSLPSDTLAGSVLAYRIDPIAGSLQLINQSSSYGESPCHISVDDSGGRLYLSHYAGGSISVFPVLENGSIGTLMDSISYQGQGPNQERQEASHLHSIQSIPGTDRFLAADLGTDRLYHYHCRQQGLEAATPPYLSTEPGAGPRHFVLSDDGKRVYIAEELSSTVSVYSLGEAEPEMLQRISTLPTDFSTLNTVADIHLSPDGRFLYVSNRGHNSLAIYSIDPESGLLTFKTHVSSGGQVPRNFLIDPEGDFVLVANQDSDNIIFFERDQETGLLTTTELVLEVPSPVCLKWR